MKEYRLKGTIQAEKVPENTRMVTVHGPVDIEAGDYLIYTHEGVKVVNGKLFENEYSEVKGDSEFKPAGKLVDVVVEFMRENPDQVERIKQEERDGANRKGILEYEGK